MVRISLARTSALEGCRGNCLGMSAVILISGYVFWIGRRFLTKYKSSFVVIGEAHKLEALDFLSYVTDI